MMKYDTITEDFNLFKVFFFDMYPPKSKEVLFFFDGIYWIRNRDDRELKFEYYSLNVYSGI